MITSYKELTIWQKTDELAHQVFNLTETFPRSYLFDLTSQLRRSALSIPTNIAEGCASFHTKEFLQFLNITRRSLSETQYLLSFAHQRALIGQELYSNLDLGYQEAGRMLSGLIKSIRTKHQTLTTKNYKPARVSANEK